jgi:hypothetical protein
MTAPSALEVKGRTHRLIASRYPIVGIFDRVASKEDALAAIELEMLTGGRWRSDGLTLLAEQDMIFGQPGAHIVMAAFLHSHEGGGRFTGSTLNGWYCAFEIETAIEETVYHHTRRLALSEAGFYQSIQMRELIVDIDGVFHNICGERGERPELYHLTDYSPSQSFGEGLRSEGSNGIRYDSVRREGGTNLVVYRPKLVLGHIQGNHFQYDWTGASRPTVSRLTSVQVT